MAKFLRMSEHSVYQVLSDCVTTLISGIDSESTLVGGRGQGVGV